MSGAKHTPGPWKTRGLFNVEAPDLIETVANTGSGSSNRDECHANARLISAAPDLLDAVERIVEHFSDGLPDHMAEELRAAIAKARGA